MPCNAACRQISGALMFQFEAAVEGQDILLEYACTAHICMHVQGSKICFLEEEYPLVFG